jgi:alpha-aminoadipate/glutamate carrier protein LysW
LEKGGDNQILNIECKDCAAQISVPDDAVVGEIVTCPDCGGDFEITSKSKEKVELKPAETVGEDWGQ